MEITYDSIASDYDVQPRRIYKVDKTGKYQRFPGLAVVADLNTDLTEWYRELDRVFPKHAQAMLPLNSLHVTIKGLWTQKSFSSVKDYNKHLLKSLPGLNAMKKSLAETGSEFTLKVSGTKPVTVYLQPADQPTKDLLNKWDKIINECANLKNPYEQKYHLSLSYLYNYDAVVTEREEREALRVVNTIPQLLSFKPPHLCKFNDMTEFIPL
eukprot:TRINITY_DN15538_c0_g1_i1.p1 TRINITY_DN15538_c0_g1~~TRINITY_DN15538_c0_g1_i1.p1  ORF type:complete len:211 (-),score=46.86 TRINITY_DN15538_c0_g1_i1:75-707(-)